MSTLGERRPGGEQSEQHGIGLNSAWREHELLLRVPRGTRKTSGLCLGSPAVRLGFRLASALSAQLYLARDYLHKHI